MSQSVEFEGSKNLQLQIHNRDRPAESCLSFGKRDEVRAYKNTRARAKIGSLGPPLASRVYFEFPLSRRSC